MLTVGGMSAAISQIRSYYTADDRRKYGDYKLSLMGLAASWALALDEVVRAGDDVDATASCRLLANALRRR